MVFSTISSKFMPQFRREVVFDVDDACETPEVTELVECGVEFLISIDVNTISRCLRLAILLPRMLPK